MPSCLRAGDWRKLRFVWAHGVCPPPPATNQPCHASISPIAAAQFGYFSRCLESECLARGISLGPDSEAMIKLADALEEEELRGICSVKTADGWYAAVSVKDFRGLGPRSVLLFCRPARAIHLPRPTLTTRACHHPSTCCCSLQIRHIGGLFRLRPNPDLQFDSCALPYADLAATISDIMLEPASSISEHYSPPGTQADLQDKAKKKADRGWKVRTVVGSGVRPVLRGLLTSICWLGSRAAPALAPAHAVHCFGARPTNKQVEESDTKPELPEADLVTFQVGEFAGLLVEAAVVGCLLWEAEKKVQGEFGYPLEPKASRAQHATGDAEQEDKA